MVNPLTFLSGLSLQFKAVLIAGVFIAGSVSGWVVHGWRTDAAKAHSITKQLKTSDSLAKTGDEIVKTKIIKETEVKYVYKDIYHEIAAKDDQRVCFADAESLSLWNRAIAGADTIRAEPAREATENADVIATVEQVLTNAAENFETCNSNAIKHNALIDKVDSLQGKMCVCGQ